MNKIRNCFESFGLMSGIKMIFLEIENRILTKSANKIIRIHSRRSGTNKLYFRKNTSDYTLVKTILMSTGEYDFLLFEQDKILRNANVIIDAGANIGLFTRICRTYNEKAKIIAIEPEASNFDLLTRNLAFFDNVHALKNGLWNKPANLIVKQEAANKWGGIVEETNKNSSDVIAAISVPEIMEHYRIDYIDIFKCDIEGSEAKVFDHSCESWIDKVGMFIIEIHSPDCEKMVLDVMKKHNFSVSKNTEDWIFIKSSEREGI